MMGDFPMALWSAMSRRKKGNLSFSSSFFIICHHFSMEIMFP